jgi:hypothetical protein
LIETIWLKKRPFERLWKIVDKLRAEKYPNIGKKKPHFFRNSFAKLWVWLLALLNIVTSGNAYKFLGWIFKFKKDKIIESAEFDLKQDFTTRSFFFNY